MCLPVPVCVMCDVTTFEASTVQNVSSRQTKRHAAVRHHGVEDAVTESLKRTLLTTTLQQETKQNELTKHPAVTSRHHVHAIPFATSPAAWQSGWCTARRRRVMCEAWPVNLTGCSVVSVRESRMGKSSEKNQTSSESISSWLGNQSPQSILLEWIG